MNHETQPSWLAPEGFAEEVRTDLAWERGLAIKCVVAIVVVIAVVVIRQLYLA